MSCAQHYQSAHFHHIDYVGSPIVVTVVSLYEDCVHGPPSSCCTATLDLMGKQTESLEVSMSFTYLY